MIGNDINDFFLNEQLPVTTKTVVIFNWAPKWLSSADVISLWR
jgi:hypothetical protein